MSLSPWFLSLTVRLATRFEIVIGGIVVPIWVSFTVLLTITQLAIQMGLAARRL